VTTAVLVLLGGLVEINPIWVYGPFRVANVTAASQPDWYMGWLEGALRLMPPWEIRAFGFEIPNPFFPGVLVPGITFGLLYGWPFLEAWRTGDNAERHLLDRPRDRPMRTALGVAALTFYGTLFVAGGDDVISVAFSLEFNRMVWIYRILLLVGPPLAGLFTHRLCLDLQRVSPRPSEDRAPAPASSPADQPAT
jgi:ubiquinol-cytochrome c reductase cytochrome b subunit